MNEALTSSTDAHQALSHLHASTCVLMTRFINGHHCPKLAQMIVSQLANLLTHPQLEQLPDSRTLYQQLLEHWQGVTRQLIEQKTKQKQNTVYH